MNLQNLYIYFNIYNNTRFYKTAILILIRNENIVKICKFYYSYGKDFQNFASNKLKFLCKMYANTRIFEFEILFRIKLNFEILIAD